MQDAVILAIVSALGGVFTVLAQQLFPGLRRWVLARTKSAIDTTAATAAVQRSERQEYADGWKQVADELRRDRDEHAKALREHARLLRAEARKGAECERRATRQEGVINRMMDRIQELVAAVIESGGQVRPWSLDDSSGTHQPYRPDPSTPPTRPEPDDEEGVL